MTFHEAAIRARTALVEAGIRPETAALDADLLARDAAGWDLATWVARRHESASEEFAARYEALIARRLSREPVAYIRGVQEFFGRPFRVTRDVLIPRPETELLIETAGAFLRDRPHAAVVDVGTGSGCIAVTLALEHPGATVYAVDVSTAALDVARDNASRLGASHVHFVHGSYLANVPTPLDLIVSNPPYVAERDRPALAPEVGHYEPGTALYGGEDGWRHIRAILAAAAGALAPDGRLMMEIGYGQSEQLPSEVAAIEGIRLLGLPQDLQGIPRVAVIERTRARGAEPPPRAILA